MLKRNVGLHNVLPLRWREFVRDGELNGAKEVPSFLSHFKTLSNGPAPGIKPATSRSAVKRSTD